MGEVYRAHDARLGRDVAIKVLPVGFSADPERLQRFEQEARAAAALNHPNILAVHDIGQHDGAPYIVSELLEGETLRERLNAGAIPLRKAVEHAIQIAHGLAAAHEKGIVHRDLKPENVFVTSDGRVKILDFGLAKLTQADPALAGLSALPTTPPNTSPGVLLGTAGYMAPEQVRGLAADHRSDIFSFGVVLYEMLCGRRAFQGDTAMDAMTAILKEEPPTLASSVRQVPPALERIVMRCLEKAPAARFKSADDLAFALDALSFPSEAIPIPAAQARAGTGARRVQFARTLFGAALVVVLATIGVGVIEWNQRVPASAPVTRFAISPPPAAPAGSTFLVNREASSLSSQAISRDGTRLALVSDGRFYLRNLNEMEIRPVAATESAFPITRPVFSPDDTWLLYVEGPIPVSGAYLLMKVPVAGGSPVRVAGPLRPLPLDVTWETEDTILYADPEGIMRVAANGGTPEILVKARDGEALGCPRILRGGAWVMFCSTNALGPDRWDSADTLVQSIDFGERRLIWKGGSDARYVPTGHIVYAQGNTLFALSFDVDELRATGTPVPIVEGIRRPVGGLSGTADFSVSDTGTLTYTPSTLSSATPLGALALVDVNGVVKKLNLPPAQYRGPDLTRDGRQLAVDIVNSDGRPDVWVYNMSGESALRPLTQGGNSGHPVWTPDSRRITFGSTRDGRPGIYWQSADGSGSAERLTTGEAGEGLFPESWSPDGRTLSFSKSNVPWTLSLDNGATPVRLVASNERGAGAVFSPDGRWIAYRENTRAGTPGQPNEQIYLEPFPAMGRFYRVSQAGGASPLWSPDGRQLFYRPGIAGMLSKGPSLMVVDIIALEPVPQWKNERVLPITSFQVFPTYRDYDITPDGKQFVMIVPAGSAESGDAQRRPINVVVNWTEELKRLVPTK
jgi:serine/threonine-protein kinase